MENVFVFDLETHNDQISSKAYAAGLYVNRLKDRCDRDLTVQEMEIERKFVIVFDKRCDNPVIKMPKNLQKTMKVMREAKSIKMVMRWLARIGLFFAHNSSGFDNWVILNSLNKETRRPASTGIFFAQLEKF